MPKTLSQFLIKEYAENPTTKTARSWRAGNTEGTRHPNIQKIIDQIGRKAFLTQAEELENAGILKPYWINLHMDIKKIDFPMSNMDKLYAYEKRQNPKEIIHNQIALITRLKSTTDKDWLIQYFTALQDKLSEGYMPANALDTPFLECLYQLANLKGYQWKRFFSEEVFHDSKKFQKVYEKRVITVLRKSPQILEEMTDDQVLAEYGILTYSQTLAWKGNLIYSINEKKIDSSEMIYGTVLNAQTIVHATAVSLDGVKKIITIENQANYENMAYQSDVLYIYVHGFPSPKERNFLKALTSIASDDTEFYHWGDMDLGGIRIYKFMKENLFPKLKPMKMDVATYLEAIKAGQGIEFDEEKRKKYIQLDAAELEELKMCILEHGKDIEQEGVRI